MAGGARAGHRDQCRHRHADRRDHPPRLPVPGSADQLPPHSVTKHGGVRMRDQPVTKARQRHLARRRVEAIAGRRRCAGHSGVTAGAPGAGTVPGDPALLAMSAVRHFALTDGPTLLRLPAISPFMPPRPAPALRFGTSAFLSGPFGTEVLPTFRTFETAGVAGGHDGGAETSAAGSAGCGDVDTAVNAARSRARTSVQSSTS